MCIHLERKIVGMEDKKDGMVKSGDSQSTTIYGREIWTNNYYQRSLSANKWKKKRQVRNENKSQPISDQIRTTIEVILRESPYPIEQGTPLKDKER